MTDEIPIHYRNKRCPSCGWRTHSTISSEYKYCPMCKTELEKYSMREKMKNYKEKRPLL